MAEVAETVQDLGEMVLAKLRSFPPDQQREVLDFVEFLEQKLRPIRAESHALDERRARRKATGWLASNVGNMVGAYEVAELVQREDRVLWRFGAFITGQSHKPWGPIGYIEVDATTGEVLADAQAAEELIRSGEHFVASLPRAEG